MSQLDLDERLRKPAPANAREVEKLEETAERGLEKGVVEAEGGVSVREIEREKPLEVADAIVVVGLVLREVHDDIVHKPL
jgi:hypothetical protein